MTGTLCLCSEYLNVHIGCVVEKSSGSVHTRKRAESASTTGHDGGTKTTRGQAEETSHQTSSGIQRASELCV